MTAVAPFPFSRDTFAPNFPPMEPHKPNFTTSFVQWIRKIDDGHSLIYKVTAHAFVILLSIVLLSSVIFSPLLLYGFKEYIQQEERAFYDQKYNHLKEYAKDHIWYWYNRRRFSPPKEPELPSTFANKKIESEKILKAEPAQMTAQSKA